MKHILSNQRGVALMMIMTAILFLTVIYGDFTFDSKISRLKATNILDRSQAKLLAESGLQMAMTRLRLYKEAYNTIQGNPNMKAAVPAQLLNQLWEVPYIYPVPVGDGAGRAVKDTIDKFQKESLLDGEMRVTVQNISNRLNLNMLRIDMQKLAAEQQKTETDPEEDPYKDNATKDLNNQSDFSVDQALFQTMKRLVDEKKEKDDAFGDRYGSVNYQDLFTNLKYYMSDFGTLNRDPNFGEAENVFQKMPMTPKFGPMTSAGELYAIPGWDDQLIELIQNEFSVYPTTQIDLNRVTANFLKILFPTLNDDEIKKYFIEKESTAEPLIINSVSDFRKYWVEAGGPLEESYFDDRIKMFEAKGISFSSNPNMFKVISEGIFNRSTYTLVATVMLPTQETTPAGGKPPADPPAQPPAQPPANQAKQTAQLLEPRIIEMQVN